MFFVGNENNKRYSEYELIAWDDSKQKSIGSIKMEENIQNVKITTGVIVITIPNKAVIFSAKTLRYLLTIEDIDCKYKDVAVSFSSNPLVIAINSWSNNNQMIIYKCKSLIINYTNYLTYLTT